MLRELDLIENIGKASFMHLKAKMSTQGSISKAALVSLAMLWSSVGLLIPPVPGCLGIHSNCATKQPCARQSFPAACELGVK